MVSGQYQEAVNYYTKAIEMDSSSAIYFANRSPFIGLWCCVQ